MMNERKGMLPSMRLDGKRALVTGAGRGIGRGAALAMAEAGAEIVAVARSGDELDALVAEIEAGGGRARAVVCDVADEAAIDRLFQGLDRLDILVNNAGVGIASSLADLPTKALDTMLAVNCRGLVLMAKAAAALIERSGGGVIVNLSSTFGKVGRPNHSVYSATKHFVEGFTKSAAIELATRGVRVVAVGPTAIRTPMTAQRLADPVVGGDLRARIPMGRVGEVEDVVGAIVFLASPAAALITGTTLMVDGGWTAQ